MVGGWQDFTSVECLAYLLRPAVTLLSRQDSEGGIKQPTVQGWILHCKDFWENFRISGFLCYKFIVLLSDFTLSIRFVTSEMKE